MNTTFTPEMEQAYRETIRCSENVDEGNCPACGDPRHGDFHTDDENMMTLDAHNAGDHSGCAYSI